MTILPLLPFLLYWYSKRVAVSQKGKFVLKGEVEIGCIEFQTKGAAWSAITVPRLHRDLQSRGVEGTSFWSAMLPFRIYFEIVVNIKIQTGQSWWFLPEWGRKFSLK